VAAEPSARLDPPVQSSAMHLLLSVANEDGLAVVLITHDNAAAHTMAEKF
jgi:peptide/nickel transport system ATP-binding protein